MGNGNWQRYAFGSRAKSPHIDVGKTIAAHIKDETPDIPCFASVARLAAMCGKSESNVRSSRKVLVKLGELRIEHRPGRSDNMFVLWDALKPLTEREQKSQRARLPTGALDTTPDTSGTRGSGRKRAHSQANTAPTPKRAPRLPTGDEPQGAPSDLGAPSAAAAGPPAASAPDANTGESFGERIRRGRAIAAVLVDVCGPRFQPGCHWLFTDRGADPDDLRRLAERIDGDVTPEALLERLGVVEKPPTDTAAPPAPGEPEPDLQAEDFCLRCIEPIGVCVC